MDPYGFDGFVLQFLEQSKMQPIVRCNVVGSISMTDQMGNWEISRVPLSPIPREHLPNLGPPFRTTGNDTGAQQFPIRSKDGISILVQMMHCYWDTAGRELEQMDWTPLRLGCFDYLAEQGIDVPPVLGHLIDLLEWAGPHSKYVPAFMDTESPPRWSMRLAHIPQMQQVRWNKLEENNTLVPVYSPIAVEDLMPMWGLMPMLMSASLHDGESHVKTNFTLQVVVDQWLISCEIQDFRTPLQWKIAKALTSHPMTVTVSELLEAHHTKTQKPRAIR